MWSTDIWWMIMHVNLQLWVPVPATRRWCFPQGKDSAIILQYVTEHEFIYLEFWVSKVNNGVLFSYLEMIACFMSIGRRQRLSICAGERLRFLSAALCSATRLELWLVWTQVRHAHVSCVVWHCPAGGAPWKPSRTHCSSLLLGVFGTALHWVTQVSTLSFPWGEAAAGTALGYVKHELPASWHPSVHPSGGLWAQIAVG